MKGHAWEGYGEELAHRWGASNGKCEIIRHSDGVRWICKLSRANRYFFYGIGSTRDEAAEKALTQMRRYKS